MIKYFVRCLSFLIRYLFALISSIYLFFGGFLFAKNRGLINVICQYFGFSLGRVKPLLPKAAINDIVNEDTSIYLSDVGLCSGEVTCVELAAISSLVKKTAALNIFEFGTFNGRTTLNLAFNSLPQAKIYTLDLPQAMASKAKLFLEAADREFINKELSGTTFKGKPCASKITQLFGDTATFDFTPFYGTMDMVFIDASHSYQYTLNDSRVAHKLLRGSKGLIMWHDYGGAWDGVTRALNELYSHDPAFASLKHITNTSFAFLQL
jgi:hypothetical protein